MIQWFIDNWELISVPLGGMITWFFTKRHVEARNLKQADADIGGTMIENISKNLDLYQRMLEDIDLRKEKAENLVEKLELEKNNLNLTINKLKIDLEICQNKL